jgi:enterochelin esterase-like enzyme
MPYERYGDQPGEGNFSQAIVEQLVPHLDQVYRTKPESKHRAAGGLSRGGGWAIHFAMVHWDVFGALGGHSPAVFFADAELMRSYIDSIPSESLPRIYLDIGERDRPEILRAAVWFEQLLNEKDVPHEWHLFSGYHNEAYWTEHMAQYLYWYTQGW